jgi:putative MATE family efflux protein
MMDMFGFPRLELVGAGLATLASQLIGLALFLAAVARSRPDGPVALRPADFRAARPLMRDVVRIALPSLGERLAMNLALLAYFRILAGYGTAAIAAYTVGIRVLAFSWIPGVGFGMAAATLVGQALGSGRERLAREAGWRATRFSVVVAVLFGIVCALAREPLARGFTDDAATVAALGPFLLCLAFAQPFLQAHFALGGALRGAGDTFTPFVAATLGNWGLRVPLACLFSLVWELDLVWVWYVLLLDHAMRTAWLARSFHVGNWAQRLAKR